MLARVDIESLFIFTLIMWNLFPRTHEKLNGCYSLTMLNVNFYDCYISILGGLKTSLIRKLSSSITPNIKISGHLMPSTHWIRWIPTFGNWIISFVTWLFKWAIISNEHIFFSDYPTYRKLLQDTVSKDCCIGLEAP